MYCRVFEERPLSPLKYMISVNPDSAGFPALPGGPFSARVYNVLHPSLETCVRFSIRAANELKSFLSIPSPVYFHQLLLPKDYQKVPARAGQWHH